MFLREKIEVGITQIFNFYNETTNYAINGLLNIYFSKKIWLNTSIGNKPENMIYVDPYSNQLLNQLDEVNLFLSISPQIMISKNIKLGLYYSFENRIENTTKIKYQFNSLFAGLKIYL